MLFAGWQIHTYYNGYQQSITDKVLKVVENGVSTYQSKQAQGLEDTKELLKNAKSETIIKERTIVNRPIYMNTCMDQDGVDLLTSYKNKAKSIIEGTSK